MLQTLGGRKFFFAVLLVVAALTLSIMGKISYDQFLATALWALGIFATANVVQKLK